ncbi:polysaccharide deacetylase family protein [Bacillus cihuensis]|uniref:polysaccharide deacetylase family protein n=1 Tax=Bacillus cihuensis TaxID=1208599 RepID=UPI0003FF5C63|nr:polysaccharide deacetylase family protein [Bacillus cihuensis]
MKVAPKGRHKLNRLGKISVGFLILFVLLLFYFIIDGIDEWAAEAGKNISQAIVVGESNISEHKIIHNSKKRESHHDIDEAKEVQKKKPVKEDEVQKSNDSKPMDEESVQEDQTNDLKQDSAADQQNAKKIPANSTLNENDKLKTGKVVYLTFDDGPHPVSLDILNLLKKYDAKATFFMLEPNMRKHPEAVKAMVREGHAVGVHGVTHDVSKVYHSPESFVSEMKQAIGCVWELTGVETKLVRAPYGSKPYITPPFKAAADQEKFLLWDWNIDSLDWKLRNGEYVQKVQQKMAQLTGKEPLLVLLHEKPSTLDHLERLLKYYHDNDYEMRPLNHSMSPLQLK